MPAHSSGAKVRRATAYATALGNYELYMNGKRIADHCMAPGYTQYDKRVAVQAYDVTETLQQGKNAAVFHPQTGFPE